MVKLVDDDTNFEFFAWLDWHASSFKVSFDPEEDLIQSI